MTSARVAFKRTIKQLLRAQALIGIGYFAGCFTTGLLVGLGTF
jgi:hypothetical protein